MIAILISNSKIDPSRTTTIRRRFAADMAKRFRDVRIAVRKLIVDDDVMGIRPKSTLLQLNIEAAAWRFRTDPQKVEAFRGWLQRQVEEKILVARGDGKPWVAA